MGNHGLRASLIATMVASVMAVGTPLVTSGPTPAAPTTAFTSDAVSGSRSIEALRAHAARADGTRTHGHRTKDRAPRGHLLVRVPAAMTVRARPAGDARAIGTMPSGSKYYGVPITAWIEETTEGGRWGRVEIPYQWPRTDGWIPLRGLVRSRTHVEVHVDLSRHWVSVTKFGHTLFGLRAATGAPVSPTPPGGYFVTDRIPFSPGGPFGSFAFGISGIQPRLPPGWSGGNQLAIHGTNAPSSIGTSASAGCVRVSERGLHRLLPLLRLGTPVVVEA